ncbi:hypothetical protein [Kordia sp.]|uniref:hypothetical protein n=1 Tax=Kordia sp. TaxID=1965332 RepID=UPI003D279BC8
MKKLLLLIFFSISLIVTAQQKKQTHTEAVKTIDGVLTKMLTIISGEKGKKRDWKALENLFLPSATFSVRSPDKSYETQFETVNLEDFIESLKDSYYDNGFYEVETGKVVNEFNGVANVFQSFYGKDSEGNEERGINSYQLVYLKNRWWIANMVWTFETDEVKIPKKYIRETKH